MSAPPRIALLGFRPGPGGIGRVMMNLVRGMAARGVALDLLLPPGDYPGLAAAGLALPVFPLDADDPGRAAEQLAAYLAERRPDALLSNKDQTNALVADRLQAPGPRPLAVFRVGTDVREKLRRRGWLAARRERRRLAAVYARADVLIGNSRGVSESLAALIGPGAPPIHTVYNPVDIAAARTLAGEAADHPWLTTRDRPVVVSVGRLVAAKDYATLIRAFRLLDARRPCRLLLLGEGGQRRALLGLARRLGVADRVDLPGFVANPFAWLARSDLFVLSSRFEGSPNALIEALAIGVPCVSTDCPSGPREILDGGRLGRLVKVGDPRALAQAMQATLAAPPDPDVLRAGAGRFDLDASVDRYLEILRGGGGRRP